MKRFRFQLTHDKQTKTTWGIGDTRETAAQNAIAKACHKLGWSANRVKVEFAPTHGGIAICSEHGEEI